MNTGLGAWSRAWWINEQARINRPGICFYILKTFLFTIPLILFNIKLNRDLNILNDVIA